MPETVIDTVSLELTGLSWWMTAICLVAAITGAVWFYRRTVPPLAGWRQTGMSLLRACALILVLAGLAAPVLHVTATSTRPTVTVILGDTSASMETPLDPGRAESAQDAISRLRNGLAGDIALYTFDTAARETDTVPSSFDGTGTDLSAALDAAVRHPDVASVVLVSDGRWNRGRDPLAGSAPVSLPVHTVLAGAPSVDTDASLTGLSVSPVGRDGATIPLEVSVSATSPITSPVPVTVLEDGMIIATGDIPSGSGTSARLTLDIPLRGNGSHQYEVTIAPIDDALETNNSRSFSVDVLKNSFTVFIAAAHPSADLSFIRRIALGDSSFTVTTALSGGAGDDVLDEIPSDLGGFDAFVLIDGAGDLLTPDAADAINRRAQAGAGLWILGSSPPGPGGAVLEQSLPVRFSGSGARADSSLTLQVTDAGRAHFVTAQSGVGDGDWGLLPPPGSFLPMEIDPRAAATLIETVSGPQGAAHPAITAGTAGNGKVLVMPLSGIWRWSLMMTGAGYEPDFLARFISSSLNWLTSPADTSPLTVTTGSQSYLSGEAVAFEARLFDHIYAPVAGAELTLTIDNDPASKTLLIEDDAGRYRGSRSGLSAGGHAYEAVATVDGAEYARATGIFTIQEYSLEQRQPSADPSLMQALAAATGGQAVTTAGVDSLIGAIESGTLTERQTADHHLALHPLLPFAAILLLVAEWAIRAARGML